MNNQQKWVAFETIVRREIRRFMRIWPQTLVPPVITMALYFVIFGKLVGSRIGEMSSLPYIQFVAPGLIMMSVITNSYSNVVSSFFGSKFQKGTIISAFFVITIDVKCQIVPYYHESISNFE